MDAVAHTASPAPPRTGWRRPWQRWFAPRLPRSVTAVVVGERCRVVRVDSGESGPRLVALHEGGSADLAQWAPLFRGSFGLLVLRAEERHLHTLDRPQVGDAELNQAVRWPLGEALEAEPDQLLTSAVALPRINDAVRAQVLGVAARVDTVRAHLALLAQADIRLRSIDVADSALRGMALLQPAGDDGTVAVALTADGVAIGLLRGSHICALRTLPLPPRRAGGDIEFAEQLALHIQRTADHFERQATQLAIRRVLACLPSLPTAARESLRAALPRAPQLFELANVMAMDDAVRERVAGDDDLSALACVATARLLDLTTPAQTVAEAPS